MKKRNSGRLAALYASGLSSGHLSGKKYFNNLKSRSFMAKLFVSYFLIINICIGCISIFSYKLEKDKMLNETIKSNSELLKHHKDTIDSFILGNIDSISLFIMQNLSDNPSVSFYFTNPVEDDIIGLLRVCNYLNKLRMINPIVTSVSLYYRSRDYLVSSNNGITYINPGEDIENIDKDDLEKLFDSSQTSAWYIGNRNMGTSISPLYKHVVIFARKIPSPNGAFSDGGVIFITVQEDVLNKIIKSYAPVDFGSMCIIDENGVVVSHSQKDYIQENIKDTNYGSKILSSPEKSGYFIETVNGVKSVVSFTSSDYTNWKIITISPLTKFSESFNYFGDMIIIITLITVIFGIFISLFSARQFSSPLRKLVDICRGINSSTNSSSDECDIIGSTIATLSTTVRKHEDRMKVSLPVIKDHFVASLITPSYSSVDEIKGKMEMLDIDFPFENFIVAVFQFGKLPTFLDIKTYEYVKLEVIEKIGEIFYDIDGTYAYTQGNDKIKLVINYKNADFDISHVSNTLLAYVNKTLQLSAYIGVGTPYTSITRVYSSYQEAERCLKYSYLHPDIIYFTPSDIEAWELNSPPAAKALVEEFYNFLLSYDKKASIDSIKKLISGIKNEFYSYNYAMKLLSKCVSYIDDMVSNLKMDVSIITEGDIHGTFNKIDNIDDLEKWLEDLVTQMFTLIDNKRSEKGKDIVQKAMEYISENITNPDISLNSVAEAMGISSTYLSHIFKAETGKNFVDCLIDTRLETAREILNSSAVTVESVCTAVGYSSLQYFTRKFKAKYKMTPKEYRDSQLKKS